MVYSKIDLSRDEATLRVPMSDIASKVVKEIDAGKDVIDLHLGYVVEPLEWAMVCGYTAPDYSLHAIRPIQLLSSGLKQKGYRTSVGIGENAIRVIVEQ